ncbi:hypothetical protein PAXINDRAFT_170709, partial [Paxillus involutus ATCC 200175]
LRLWVLRHSKGPSLLSNAFITPAESLGKIYKFRSKNHMSLAPVGASLRADALTKPALIMVCTKVVRAGAPSDPANIYKMDDIEAPTRLTPKYQQAAQTDIIVGYGALGTPRSYGEKASRSVRSVT